MYSDILFSDKIAAAASNVRKPIDASQYRFLDKIVETHEPILIGFGGSHAYGTNIESSDTDIRGIAMNTADEAILGKDYEQFVNEPTDTTIYSFLKMIKLLTECNPNTIEILGLEDWQYIYMDDVGKALVDNADMFLSKRAAQSFGGYAKSQLRRLERLNVQSLTQPDNESYILKVVEEASKSFKKQYFPFGWKDYINLYIDDAVNDEFDEEIFMDVHLSHYPLRDYRDMWSDVNNP